MFLIISEEKSLGLELHKPMEPIKEKTAHETKVMLLIFSEEESLGLKLHKPVEPIPDHDWKAGSQFNNRFFQIVKCFYNGNILALSQNRPLKTYSSQILQRICRLTLIRWAEDVYVLVLFEGK